MKEPYKMCYVCKRKLPLKDFYKHHSSIDGLQNACKDCSHMQSKKWYKENGKAKYKRILSERPYYLWAKSALASHKARGHIINITTSELSEMASVISVCQMCGKILAWNKGDANGKTIQTSPSLDRINNEHIINRNNIQIICRRCNFMKNDMTMNDYINHCKMILIKFDNAVMN